MSKISLSPDVAGTGIFTIASPNSNTNRTLTLPDDTGTIVTNSGNQAGSFTTLNTSGQVVFNDAGANVDFRVEGDTDANLLFVDASTDRVGVKINAPSSDLHINPTADDIFTNGLRVQRANETTQHIVVNYSGGAGNIVATDTALSSPVIRFLTSTDGTTSTERARITSGGALLVGTTSNPSNGVVAISYARGTSAGMRIQDTVGSGGNGVIADFYNSSGVSVGSITHNSTNTTYGTSSDYRLKENIAPMTGALAKVLELNPVTYTWKADGSAGEGFIAHELQEVAPYAVSGEKDGDEMQGVDYGKITPLLTAALQEAIAEIQSLKARVAELEAK